jgi:putative hydrolase of the HAD superfamily
MLRWIAFDAVGTLIDPHPDVATAYARIGAKYDSRRTVSEVRTRFRSAFAASTAVCLPCEAGQILTSEDLEANRWRWIVEHVLDDVQDRAACFTELYDHFADPANWRLFDDAPETLSRLRDQGLRLAMASNFDQRLHAVCRGIPELQIRRHRAK